MLQDCILWYFLNHYYVQIVGIVCMHVFLGEAKPRARSSSCAVYLCSSLTIVALYSSAKIFTVNSPRRRTLLGSVCLTEFHSESLWFLRLLFWTTLHLQFTHPRGMKAHLQARLSIVQFQKEKFDLYQIIVLISLCGVTFWVL